jgi:hypothetical protein
MGYQPMASRSEHPAQPDPNKSEAFFTPPRV